MQSPKTEIIQICGTLLGKTCENTSSELLFGGFFDIWNLCAMQVTVMTAVTTMTTLQ